MKVIIVGGSIAGLLHGVMLKHHGHDVEILERSAQDLESQAAGFSITDELKAFMELHDRSSSPFTLKLNGVHVVDRGGRIKRTIYEFSQVCSWDALYYRLRANFDGLTTKYCPEPPGDDPKDGSATYSLGKEVTGIESQGPHQQVIVNYRDVQTGLPDKPVRVDLVIGADGASSSVRKIVAPRAPERKSAGYVAWQGVISETSVPTDIRNSLSDWFTFHVGPREYVAIYKVPGRNGSLQEGERYFNFVWYSWQTPEALRDILTDKEGHTHQWYVPAGKVRSSVWEKQRIRAFETFSSECSEVLRVAQNPFVQVIGDCAAPSSPGPTFSGGRIILVGDAQSVLRPHAGYALNQAARHCLELEMRVAELERAMSDNPQLVDLKAVESWDETVLNYGEIAGLKSISWGMFYMKSGVGSLSPMMSWRKAMFMIKWKKGCRTLILGRD